MNRFNNVAALDIGTNSFHLIIASIGDDNKIHILDRKREVLRLSSKNLNGEPVIKLRQITSAVVLIKKFQRLAKIYNTEITAVATSAVREAINKNEFLEIVKKNTGIKVKIIQGKVEAELIYNAVVNYFDELANQKILCIDIGGGSTEFIVAKKNKIFIAESLKLGAVRFAKEYFTNPILAKNNISLCELHIEKELKKISEAVINEKFVEVTGSSGTIQTVRSILKEFYKINLVEDRITKEDVEMVFDLVMSKKDIEERLQIPGLEFKRADIFPAGILILKKIFDLLELKSMRVSDYALREGIIYEMCKK